MVSSGEYTYADYEERPDPSHRPLYLAGTLKYLAGIPEGGKVLDAGCGGGDFSIGLDEAGYDVYGSDMSRSGIAAAQQRGIGTFLVASIYENLAEPFGLTHFDAIVCVEVIEHLYSPRTFARRANEALLPGGLVVISTPYWGYLKNIMLAVTDRMDRSLTPLWEGGHIKHWSRKTLTQLMTDAGFEVVGFEGCSEGLRRHTPYLWNGMLMAFRKKGSRTTP